jgi:hypothetical protein
MLKGLGDPMIEPANAGSDLWEAKDKWKKLVGEVAPDMTALQDPGYNCRIGYPLSVLEARLATFGKQHPYLRQWLRTQEAVFQACGSSPAIAGLPDPIELVGPDAEIQAQDRAYQEASISFYRDKQLALQQFRRIAKSDSPHRASARYNVANLLANAKMPAEARAEARAILADPAFASVHAITEELLGYIANLEDTAQGWTELIDSSVATIDLRMSDIKSSPMQATAFARALYDIDYIGIRAKNDDWWLDGKLPENPTVSKAIVDASRKHAIVPWMIAGQTAHERTRNIGWQHETAVWQQNAKAYVDRAAALVTGPDKIPPLALTVLQSLVASTDDASRAALWQSAATTAKAASDSCGEAAETAAAGVLLQQAVRVSAVSGKVDEAIAGLTVSPLKTSSVYAQEILLPLVSSLVGQGKLAEARAVRDKLVTPAYLAGLQSSENVLAKDRLAGLLAWMAEDDARWSAAIASYSNKSELAVMNLLPVARLWQMADDPVFPADERALFARAAWTRDYALGKKADPAKTEKLLKLNPALDAIWKKIAADYPKTDSVRQQVLAVLRSPRLNMLVNSPAAWNVRTMTDMSDTGISLYDHNDQNWWCPLETDRLLGALRGEFDALTGNGTIPEYLQRGATAWLDPARAKVLQDARESVLKDNPAVAAIDWVEVRKLAKAASAPKALSESAIRWAKRRNPDDGAAEALALAIKTTRYGCNWHGGHAAYSKVAHKLLQTKFGATEWAKSTPYWFDCQRSVWDKDYNKVVTCEPMKWEPQKLPN